MIATPPLRRRPAPACAAACTALLLAGAVAPGDAFAGLGGASMPTPAGASVADLGPASAAAQPGAGAPRYTVRETTLASGTVVREFLTRDAVVFGVAWRGPRMPDLAALLGGHFAQYASTVGENRRSGKARGQGVVESEALVVHSGGHMGAFFGNAWLPQALPAGVTAADIQ